MLSLVFRRRCSQVASNYLLALVNAMAAFLGGTEAISEARGA